MPAVLTVAQATSFLNAYLATLPGNSTYSGATDDVKTGIVYGAFQSFGMMTAFDVNGNPATTPTWPTTPPANP